jgi:hypothetical protein
MPDWAVIYRRKKFYMAVLRFFQMEILEIPGACAIRLFSEPQLIYVIQ